MPSTFEQSNDDIPQPYPEERRIATVLFADIQGFTQLADHMDFEAVSDLIKEVWLRIDTIIEEHGGRIDKHIGDAVMAVWGAPHGSEDDAERAVAAGLAMQAALADYAAHSPRPGANQLKMRVGLNTGPVLASHVGRHDEYTVMGDTVNVASRLEHVAEVETVTISDSTYHLVRGLFRVRSLAPVLLKGKTQPLGLFVVESALTQPTRVRYRGAGGLETRMVAREAEVARLGELYERSRQGRTPLLTLVRGEAGMGKSRLLLEFTSQLEANVPGLTLLSMRGLVQASRVPFFLWKSLWFNRFGLSENDPPEAAREKFLRGTQELWGRQSATPVTEAAHFIGSLAGLDWPDSPTLAAFHDQPEARARRAFDFTRLLLCRMCAAGPTLLALDDLHLADEGSLDLLTFLLVPAAEPLPLFILGSVRPGFLRHRPVLNDLAHLVALNPLPINRDVVVAAYPSLSGQSEGVLAELAQRAEGNPYFLEELVKGWLQSQSAVGTGELRARLPDSLQATLQARLDAISPGARNVAMLASAVGRVFWTGAVRAAGTAKTPTGTRLLALPAESSSGDLQASLTELVRAELVFRRVGSVFADETEYIFKHSLLRDVAYERLPHKHRKVYHLAVARWLEAHAGPDFLASVADHLERAGEYVEAARQSERAASFAQSRGATKEATWLLEHARQLHARPPGSGLLPG
jgi:class 3 adenylate cyclase